MQTYPCNEHPLLPHFSIVKMGFTWVYFFLISAPKHRLWVHIEAVLTCTHNQCFEQNVKGMPFLIFIIKFSIFTAQNISGILHGQVFVINYHL